VRIERANENGSNGNSHQSLVCGAF
jgi:hypothetical protein